MFTTIRNKLADALAWLSVKVRPAGGGGPGVPTKVQGGGGPGVPT